MSPEFVQRFSGKPETRKENVNFNVLYRPENKLINESNQSMHKSEVWSLYHSNNRGNIGLRFSRWVETQLQMNDNGDR